MSLSYNKYSLWYHNPNEKDFTESSFMKVLNITNADELLAIHNVLKNNEKLLLNGLFYLMKDEILPVWYNKDHINGGCISWKIDRSESVKCWENLLLLFTSGNFNNLEEYKITGISINPKKNCSILKIWLSSVIPKHKLNSIKLPNNCIFKEKFKIFKIFKSFLDH